MTAIVQSNPFDQALAALEKDIPATFELVVDEHVFRDVGSLENARVVSSAMENMKHRARAMGYTVDTVHDNAKRQWVYGFVKTPPAPVKVVTA